MRRIIFNKETTAMLRSLFGALVKQSARDKTAGRGTAAFVVGWAASRIATRSIPGALLVGGGLLAKHLYDRNKEQDPAVESVRDKFARNPQLAAEIARERPELLTDAADDKDRAEEIERRTGDKPETIPAS